MRISSLMQTPTGLQIYGAFFPRGMRSPTRRLLPSGRRSGRIPTQAEVMAVRLKIDRMVAPYLQRAGVSRPGPRPK